MGPLPTNRSTGLFIDTLAEGEPLEQKKMLAVDVILSGTELSVVFDDAAADTLTLEINSTGYVASGDNSSSATALITKLTVTDAGTAFTSGFTLVEAAQILSGGLTIGSNISAGDIAADVNAGSGTVSVDAATLALGGDVTAAAGQTYGSAVTLTADVTLNATTGSISFGSTLDSDLTRRTLVLQAGDDIHFTGAVGAIRELAALTLARADAVTADSTLAINGTGRDLDGLRVDAGVNNVTLNKSGSTIIGANQASINFSGGSTGSHLAGFAITKSNGPGILGLNGDYATSTITNMTVEVGNATPFALELSGARGLTIGGPGNLTNIFRGGLYGGGVTGNLAGTVVTGNAFENCLVGFRLNDATNFTLNGTNTFEDYRTATLDASVRPVGSTTPTPASPPAFGPVARTGLYAVGDSSGTFVTGNKFENGFDGLTLDDTTNLTINGNNTIRVFTNAGINVYGKADGTLIENNTIVGEVGAPATVGAKLVDATNLTIKSNIFREIETGLLASGTLTGSLVFGNDFNGTTADPANGSNGTTGINVTGAGLRIENNTITGFDEAGVRVAGNLAINNALLANSIFLNGNQTGAGIALIDGGNGDQAAPVVYTAAAIGDSGNITLTGVLTAPPGSLTAPNGDYRIEVFRNLAVDEVGFPANVAAFEGRTFLLAENVTVLGGGAALSINLPAGSLNVGDWATLTATSLSANQPLNTSAFSNAVQVTAPVLAVGTNGPSSPGVVNPPAARLYEVGSLNSTNILDPANATNSTLISEGVTDAPLLNVGDAAVANATVNINLANVYGESFATTFTGGLRVAHADLDGDGYDDLITAPGPTTDASFGDALRTIGIFNGNPTGGGWTSQLINVGTTFGTSYTGGFLVAVGDVARVGALPDAAAVEQIIVAPSSAGADFNGAAVFTVAAAARGAQPAVDPGILLTTPEATGTITGLTAGAYGGLAPIGSGGTDGEVSISLATNAGGITTVTQYRRTATSGSTLVQHSQFAVTLDLNEGDGATVNVFAYGAGLTAGDLNGDRIDDLIVTASVQGMSNFRAIGGSTVMTGSQAAINEALGTNFAPFSSVMAGGRFAGFVPPPGPDPAQQTTNLDYFYDGGVPPFTGLGFNAPLYATTADTDGDGRFELFIALGNANSTENTIKHFAFFDSVNPADRWFVRQGFRALDLGTGTFQLGEGLRLG